MSSARLQTGMIEIAPLAFMRGRTLTNAVVLLDEAQNATSVQMKMFLTRLGEGSRMIITGDPSQVDLPPGQRSGLDRGGPAACPASRVSAMPASRRATSSVTRSCAASSWPMRDAARKRTRRARGAARRPAAHLTPPSRARCRRAEAHAVAGAAAMTDRPRSRRPAPRTETSSETRAKPRLRSHIRASSRGQWREIGDLQTLRIGRRTGLSRQRLSLAPVKPMSRAPSSACCSPTTSRIRIVNRDWRGFDKATNVLSFPAAPPERISARARCVGDIVIAYRDGRPGG